METLAPLVSVPALAIAIYKKTWTWPSRAILIALAGLLMTAAVSFFANHLPHLYFIKYIGEFRWIFSYICFVQFFNIYYKHIDFRKLIFFLQCILLIAGFYSFYQFFTGHDFFRSHITFHQIYEGSQFFRPNSFFGLPTTHAYASSMFFAFSLAFWLREKPFSTRHEKITRLYFFVSCTNIFLTFTRAAWIAFLTSLTTLLAIINKKLCARIVLAVLILFAALYTSMPSFQSRIDSIFDINYIANYNRIYLWKANWNMFKENPWLGLGFNENLRMIDHYLDPFNKPEIMRNHPHSTYLNFLAGLGIFGFTFFILFIGFNLKHTIQGVRKSQNSLHKTLYIGALGAQIVLLIGGFTECNFEDIELTHQYILYAALVEYLRQQDFPS